MDFNLARSIDHSRADYVADDMDDRETAERQGFHLMRSIGSSGKEARK
jgi:hypothetical protein